ncbi:MAG TPA: SBBP repeat-containing protein, partial [Bryobacteraceae bacterium]|nr:SBBP repeat-containing protein [Bryobacteraceae bacterium]
MSPGCPRGFGFAVLGLVAVGATLTAQTSAPRQKILAGSGFENATAVATDPSGYIYVAGTTSSPDFPLLNATQTVLRGQALVVSFDSGASWRPANLSDPFIATLVVDPTDGFTVYAASGSKVYKTTDGGLRWFPTKVETFGPQGSITLLAVDPQKPQTIYAAGQGLPKIAKSDDGGITWKTLNLPPTKFLSDYASTTTLDVDPFHSGTLYAANNQSTYVTYDGGENWGKVLSPAGTDGEFHVYFDPSTPDVQYAFEEVLYKSTDAGQTWKPLNSPVLFYYGFAVDPVRPGYLYAQGDGKFFRSRDSGATWESFVNTNSGFPVADPNSNVIQAGLGRSTDGGITWKPAPLSRSPSTLVFARSVPGRVYAVSNPSTSGFVAKLTPSLEIVFSTYLGGGGETTPHAIVTDGAGNIYVAGETYSADFPVTPGALQREFGGDRDAFVVKLSSEGQLLWGTYLGGRFTESANALALDRDGSVIIAGSSSSLDFPTVPPTGQRGAFVAKLSPDGNRAIYVKVFAGCNAVARAVATDPNGSIVVAGDIQESGQSPADLNPTADALQPKPAGDVDGFWGRLDSSGAVTYLSYWGGFGGEFVTGVAVDSDGNAYLAGTTNSFNFPTTPGVYQRSQRTNCVYPPALGFKLIP